jgi:tetratricopeptide (TPR) repeat protein
MLARAWQLYRAGALDEAEAALPADPADGAALHLRGLIALARGDRTGAAGALRRAVHIRPDDADVLSDCGTALGLCGEADAAAALFRRAIALNPRHADALYNLGNAEYAAGRFAEAEALYARAVAARPGFAAAHNNLGNALAAQGRTEDALAAFRAAVSHDDALAEAHANMARLLAARGETVAAEAAYARALALAPDNAAALNDRGNLLLALGRAEEAEDQYRAALALRPDFSDAQFNLGNALVARGRMVDAIGRFRAALALDPAHAGALTNLGTTLARLGLLDDAAEQFEAAALLGREDAIFALGTLRLLAGDFARGWEGYEARPREEVDRFRYAGIPLWDGAAPLAGARILLHAEQGFGDTIQFARYAALVAARGAEVVLDVQPALVPLMATCDGAAQVVGRDQAAPEAALRLPLMSLPRAFATRPETIPARVPYLRAEPDRVARWRAWLGADARPRIGLAWSGNPAHRNDRDRSIPASALTALVAREDVSWHAVHTGLRGEDAALLARMRRHDDRLTDFAETAALVTLMDLVIAADTSVAHLAGALARPVWILLPYAPDWRWMLDRADSPWYPTARLFRQRAPGDWASVIRAVSRALDGFSPALPASPRT